MKKNMSSRPLSSSNNAIGGGEATKHTHATKEGEINKVIRAFNRYEINNFEKYKEEDGLSWWCVVRYSVAHAICVERGLYGSERAAPETFFHRGLSFLRQSARLVRDIVLLMCIPAHKLRMLFIGTRNIHYLAGVIGKGDPPALVIGGPMLPAGKHAEMYKHSIDFFVRLAWPVMPVPKDILSGAVQLDREIRALFDSKLDIRRIILTKYRQHRASRLAWRFILSRAKHLRKVVFVNDDTLKTLVHLAHLRGIETEEVQHAYMGCSHEGFSYPALAEPLTTLPDTVAVWRDTGDIVYPVPVIHVARNNCEETVTQAELSRDIDVLIGSSPGRISETRTIIDNLADGKLRIAVKLHPVQREQDLQTNSWPEKASISIYSGNTDFKAVACKARVFIPVGPNSTTGFEAVENGCKLITVHYNGKKLTEMLDNVVSASVNSIEALPRAVEQLLTDCQ